MQTPITFLINGYDDSGLFEPSLIANAVAQSNTIILRPNDQKMLAQTIGEAGIKAGDTVIFQSHSEVGTFQWRKDEYLPRTALFTALPHGLSDIQIHTCHSGTAVEYAENMRAAPHGTLVFTNISGASLSYSVMDTSTAMESGLAPSPIDRFIKTLDNLNLSIIEMQNTYWNRVLIQNHEEPVITDPAKVLPHKIGIGGTPPRVIDLNDIVAQMGPARDEAAAAKALTKVQHLFDLRGQEDADTIIARINGQEYPMPNDHSAAEIALDGTIAMVDAKIHGGIPLENANELRIGYALAAAYLESSGTLEQMRQQAIASSERGLFGALRDEFTQLRDRFITSDHGDIMQSLKQFSERNKVESERTP